MDPINNPTPIPNPMPTPTPTPDPVSDPVSTPEPIMPEPVVSEPVVPEPTMPEPTMPEPTISPVPEPVSNPTPPPVVPAPVTTPTPVNPVINPTGNTNFTASMSGIAATDPIMKPEPAKAPDPIEEELKAPMKAAGPVPGSIGSAVSGPASENGGMDVPMGGNPFDNMPKERTQNVPFNDPAMEPNSAQGGVIGSGSGKKPQNKKVLIALVAVAAVIVVALVVVLVMQLTGGNSTPTNNTPIPAPDSSYDENTTSENVLNCKRDMTAEELVAFKKAVSGTIEINAKFSNEDVLVSVSLSKTATYDITEGEIDANDPVEVEKKEAEAANLTSENASNYYLLSTDKTTVMTDLSTIRAHYEEDLAFICDIL